MEICVKQSFRRAASYGLLALAAACASTAPTSQELARQVADTERAFARSMALRDHAAFVAHLS